MIKKLATILMAAAFGLAIYTPSASACPGMDDTKTAEKDDAKNDKKAKKKVADKKKAKDKSKAKDKDKAKDGKKVTRR